MQYSEKMDLEELKTIFDSRKNSQETRDSANTSTKCFFFFQKYRANIGNRKIINRNNIAILEKHLHVFIALKFIIFYIQRKRKSNFLVHLQHGHS